MLYLMRPYFSPISLSVMALLSSGCGTTIGNPQIVLQSAPYQTSAPQRISDLARTLLPAEPSQTALLTVSDFRFCVTKLKLKNADGAPVKKDGAESLEAKLGLINVSDATVAKTWGEVTVPTGFLLRELRIELHRDPELCGDQDFSVSFNGQSIRKDLEFKFEFDPAVPLDGGETFELTLTNIAAALVQAEGAGKLNDNNISEYINDNIKGSGTKR